MDTESKNKIILLEQKITELENKINSLFSISSFPLDIINILISRGFYNVDNKEITVYSEGGAGGNTFKEKYRSTRFGTKTEYYNYPDGLKQYTINITTNVCFCPNNGFLDGQYLSFKTIDTLPGGLDNTALSYKVLNATQDTFQVTTDGVNPVDITSIGSGEQYALTF